MLDKELDEVVKAITDSLEYKKCLELKEKMKDNDEINDLVNKVKKLQKEYVKTNDIGIKKELDDLEKELDNIPIYVTYKNNLVKVNEKIDYIKDELNDYFYKLFNEEK